MATIKPFKALRPKPELAEQVASVPYDVVNRSEAKELAGDNKYSFLRIVRSEIEFPEDTSPYEDEVYAKAKSNLDTMIADGSFIEDETDSFYVYRVTMGAHQQFGIVGCSAVDDYDSGVVKLHEKTRPEKENDRTKHMITVGAQAGPVFLAYKNVPELTALMNEAAKETPLYDVHAEDGVQHTIWRCNDNDKISQLFANIPATYVADGHHRAASASRCRAELRENNAGHTGKEDYNYFLSVLFPDDQLDILPYNRIVKPLPIKTDKIISSISEVYEVSETSNPSPEAKGGICMYLDGKWYQLAEKDSSTPADPVAALDVSKLQDKVLTPVFGIGDPRTDKNIEFIGGIRGTKELERLVDSGQALCGFSMFPVSIAELFEIADCGMTMAPKSTWFEPKLRSGLLVNRFDQN